MQSITANPSLPKDLTSYDLLKSFAVIIMIIDHTGGYFFPDDLWWKAIGRIGFPVWFFLVGHASGRDLPQKLLGGALILIFANWIVGKPIFPLNALVTIALIRITIDWVMAQSLRTDYAIYLWSAFLFFMVIPTMVFVEYGTLGLITAMFGYMIRHRQTIHNETLVFCFMIFALLAFIGYQQVIAGFSQEQFYFMAIGTLFVRMYLYYFDRRHYPRLSNILPGFVVWSLQFGGRRTLEIYVVHLLIFKFAALMFGISGDEWFDFRLSSYFEE